MQALVGDGREEVVLPRPAELPDEPVDPEHEILVGAGVAGPAEVDPAALIGAGDAAEAGGVLDEAGPQLVAG
jgi:hypothetical protein